LPSLRARSLFTNVFNAASWDAQDGCELAKAAPGRPIAARPVAAHASGWPACTTLAPPHARAWGPRPPWGKVPQVASSNATVRFAMAGGCFAAVSNVELFTPVRVRLFEEHAQNGQRDSAKGDPGGGGYRRLRPPAFGRGRPALIISRIFRPGPAQFETAENFSRRNPSDMPRRRGVLASRTKAKVQAIIWSLEKPRWWAPVVHGPDRSKSRAGGRLSPGPLALTWPRYSITSSASANKVGGTTMPSAFAVF
jgi:hypothetical protein